MEFTGERVVEGKTPVNIWQDHINRYFYVSQFTTGKVVLDIACGTGYGSYILSDKGKCKRVIGIDISQEAIRFAQNNYSKGNIEFLVGNAENVGLCTGVFDVIVSFETIEHLINYEHFLLELKRLLKKNGYLYISVPNREVGCAFCDPNYKSSLGKFHRHAFNLREFLSILREHFQVYRFLGQRMVPKPSLIFPFRKILKKITPNLFDLGTGSPVVRSLTYGFTPRYLLFVCKK